jgi:flagellar M-ring protein FliF
MDGPDAFEQATDSFRGGDMATAGAANSKVKDLLAKMTAMQKVAVVALVITLAAGSVFVSRSQGSAEMAVLFTDLSAADASSIVDELSASGVAYELTDAGRTITVPASQVYNLRVDLAGKSLPASNEGYALLDNQGITQSEFSQRVDYQRALEGELAMTVSALEGVKSASVHLALPSESVFLDEQMSPTASVLVTGNGTITEDEVQAIVHLVASSVKGMKPADVTVVDSTGLVLSGAATAGPGGGSATRAAAEVEKTTAARVAAMLSRMTGPNKVAVTVNATVDLDQSSATSERWDPVVGEDGTPSVSGDKTATETYTSTGPAGSGTGVLGPDGAVIAPVEGTAGSSVEYEKADSEQVYVYDRTVEQTVKATGAVTRLNVAVLIDEEAVSEEQVAQIEEMVATAAGVDAERGDTVSITRMPFDTSADEEADKEAQAQAGAAAQSELFSLIRTVLIVVVVIVALFLGYRSSKSARRLTMSPISFEDLPEALRPTVLATQAAAPVEEERPAALVRPPSAQEELGKVANDHPEEIALVLRTWLNESKSKSKSRPR